MGLELIAGLSLAIDAYYSLTVAEHERAPVHGGRGPHNIAFDPGSHDANGIFDYADAAWAQRHHDFRYLMFGAVQDTLLDATMRAYTAATGFGSTKPVSGRTLAQDLEWTGWALKRGGF